MKNKSIIRENELRIGNHFIGYDGKEFQWLLSDFNILFTGVDVDELIKSPIPLTPEVLESCGFEVFPWGYVKKSSKDFGVRINLRSFNYDVSGNSPVKIEYLHQLQNLYFALTGEELEVNPN